MESSRLISPRAMSIESCSSSRVFAFQLARLPLHQLQMDVEGIERVADLVRYAGGEQGERIQSLALDRFLRCAPALGDVAQDDGVADLLAVAAVVGRGIFISVKPATRS